MPAIDVQHIVKRFGDFTAVNDVSFAVEKGEIFGLLGPNGAGKSTLIRMLTTLLPPPAGTALIGGIDIAKDPDGVRKVIGVIPSLPIRTVLPSASNAVGTPFTRRNTVRARAVMSGIAVGRRPFFVATDVTP